MLKVMIKCQEGQMKQPQRMHYKKKKTITVFNHLFNQAYALLKNYK